MLLDDLKNIVGDAHCKSGDDLRPHLTEWRGDYEGRSPLLVAPANVAEVAAIVRRCARDGVGIVPQGANTGMCAGAIPDASNTQIILSLARMKRIRNIDADNYSMQVEAGCVLQAIREAAADADRYFPLSLGAEGSCLIGGNLSTNAGGINVLRYGTARAQVLGLEAVLANGDIVSDLRGLRKNTAGYDLKQLFIGSEGTLGIITAATLKLWPAPGELTTIMAALGTSGDAVKLLSHLRAAFGERIESFELMSAASLALVERHIEDARLPFDERPGWYVLTDLAIRGEFSQLESVLQQAADDKILADAILAKSNTEAAELWQLRHSIAEAERAEGKGLKHDISLPLSNIERFLDEAERRLAKIAPAFDVIAFGHVGDGNLHYNVRLPAAGGAQATEVIYDLVAELGGSFSAEHGIGQAKRHWLPRYRSDTEMSLMRQLKSALDPHGILNPGKVI